ncbi:plasmalemma vesicle-associated protein [Lissotriton helveticus]
MDKSPYTMSKFGLEYKDSLHSKQKGCWSYLKYFFLFTSLIQSLIILGLVLFMVYGNPQLSQEERLQERERSAHGLSRQVLELQAQRANASRLLNATAREAEQARLLQQMALRHMAALNQTNAALRMENMQHRMLTMNCRSAINTATKCEQQMKELNLTCSAEKLQLREEKHRLETNQLAAIHNCTTGKQALVQTADSAVAERENFHKQMIALREEKRSLSDQLNQFKTSCSAIDDRFQGELRQLEVNFNAALQRALPNQASSPFESRPGVGQHFNPLGQDCKLLSSEINSIMKESVERLNRQVSSVLADNSLLRTQQAQATNQLDECRRTKESMGLEIKAATQRQQAMCDAEMSIIYKEKEGLKREKEDLGKRVVETSQALQTTQMQLSVKTREAERCPKIPFGTGPKPAGSVNLNDLNDQINRLLGDKSKNPGSY